MYRNDHIPFHSMRTPVTLTSLYHFFHQVLHVKFQGILLQLAEGVQGFAPNQLAKGVTISKSLDYYSRVHYVLLLIC